MNNIIKLVLDYAATFKVADMYDPDELIEAERLFSYYCIEKFTKEEKEVLCKVAEEQLITLQKTENISDKEIQFYKSIRDTIYCYESEIEEKGNDLTNE